MTTSAVPGREFFEREARSHLVSGDLFTFKNPVIPTKTGGRWYGGLSQHVAGNGIALPSLRLCEARFVDPYIFVALWDDSSRYPDVIGPCAAACLRVASGLGLETLVLPLGGAERAQYLWLAERALFQMADDLDEKGAHVPSHVYVTDKDVG